MWGKVIDLNFAVLLIRVPQKVFFVRSWPFFLEKIWFFRNTYFQGQVSLVACSIYKHKGCFLTLFKNTYFQGQVSLAVCNIYKHRGS